MTYLSGGWSLDPLVKTGDECTFDPIYDINLVHPHDVVVCEPNKDYTTNTGRKSNKWFAIGNQNGHIDAWAKEDSLYGTLVVVRSTI